MTALPPPEHRGLRQPDARSCGAATVVMAEARHDPAFAERACADQDAFATVVLRRHRELTRWPPWPRMIGTPPWAVARALTAVTGVPHHTRLARWRRSAPPPPSGALYVGSRWLPRHVVLMVAEGRCYEPASGRVAGVPRDAFAAGELSLAGWSTPWFVVRPVDPRGRRSPA
jgi:hypothetical protein